MLNRCFPVAAFAFWVAISSVAPEAQEAGQNKQALAIRAHRLIDGTNDKVVKDAVVLVVGVKIAAVGSRLAIPANARVIDLGDVTSFPV